MSVAEPLIVNVHDKGPKRGLALYFGVEEVSTLERTGISIRDTRRLLATTDGKRIVLVPLSEIDTSREIRDVEGCVDTVLSLSEDEAEEVRDGVLSIVIGSRVELGTREKGALLQLVKGQYTRHTWTNALQACMRADAEATLRLLKERGEKNEHTGNNREIEQNG
jgi:hypothetical protein